MKTKPIILMTAMFLYLTSSAQLTERISQEAMFQTKYAFELCKYLHQNPELSFQEFATADRMAQELEQLDFEVTRNFGGNNVVGLFRNGEGPVVMIRTDMDALPIEEKTGFDFASTRRTINTVGTEVPVMHACGHDIHMSVWTGTLRTLIALKENWSGTLLVIAQESEEVSGGATKAINEGLFQKFPVPSAALAFHINPELASGTIGLVEGPVFAGVRTAEITVFGIGGHGAYPEKAIDPVVIAARIVIDLQTIVSREINPLEPAVVTVGSIHGGTRPNIIPDEVKMELTLRYYSDETITKIIASLKRISAAAAQMAGMPEDKLPEVKILDVDTPPVMNDKHLAKQLEIFTGGIIGSENILRVKPAMVGEDFGKYGYTPEKVPTSLIWLGSSSPALLASLKEKGQTPAPLHSPYLLPDFEATIETGIKVMTSNVIGLMQKAR
ncbi:MAG: amidohydrolase [Bacteroidales bacterium]|nr:amidohydrolase [Bacteroidales bacterium]